MTATLQCPDCRKAFTLAQVFDRCTVSWPEQQWLSFKCDACRKKSHVEVAPGKAAIGKLDGAPGPCFFASGEIRDSTLKVEATGAGIVVQADGRSWRFPAR